MTSSVPAQVSRKVLHRSEHVRVHVVRGLIEDEDVRLVQQGQQELQATPLAAGQVLHPVGEHIAQSQLLRELAGCQIAARRLVLGLLPTQEFANELAHERLEVPQLLVEDRDGDRLPLLHRRARRGDPTSP